MDLLPSDKGKAKKGGVMESQSRSESDSLMNKPLMLANYERCRGFKRLLLSIDPIFSAFLSGFPSSLSHANTQAVSFLISLMSVIFVCFRLGSDVKDQNPEISSDLTILCYQTSRSAIHKSHLWCARRIT